MSACSSPVPYVYLSLSVNPGFLTFCILSAPLESIFSPLLFFFHLNFPSTSSPLSQKPNKPTFLSPNRGWFMVLRQQPLSWPDPALMDAFQLLPSSTWQHLGSRAAIGPGAGSIRNMRQVRAGVTQQSMRGHAYLLPFRDGKGDPEFNQLFLTVQYWGTRKPIKSNKGRDVG